MTERVYTYEQREKSRKNARAFVRLAVEGRRADVQRFLWKMEEALEAGETAGADKSRLYSIAEDVHDAVTLLVKDMRKDLDAEGCDVKDADIDLSDLDALIMRLA